MTYEDVLKRVGTFGTFQKRMCLLIFCSSFTCALGTLTMIFTMYSPKHRCKLSEEALFGQVAIPSEDFNFTAAGRCNEIVQIDNGSYHVTNNSCSQGWVYAEPDVSTIVTEFDLVCSNSWQKPLVVSLFMLGEMIAGLIGGPLSDRFGRKPILLVSKLIEFVMMFGIGFAADMTSYMALMAVLGCGIYTSYATSFVLGNELMGKKHRNKVSICVYGGYCFGASVVPALGYLLKDWRWLMRCSGLIGVLYIPLYWLLPESPYWLLSSGKQKEALKILEMIAKINKTASPDKDVMMTFKSEEEEMMADKPIHEKSTNKIVLLHLLTVSTLRWRMLVAGFSWLVTNMVYYGLALNISALSGDRFWNAAISGLLEFPGIIGGFLLIRWIGRPLPLSLLMGAGGVCLAAAPFLASVSASGMAALVLIGKTFIIAAFYINFSITGEMFPTLLRNASIGFASAAGKIGSFIAPYLMYLVETSISSAPFLIMGGLACASSIASILTLPETKGKVLPDSIEDAELLRAIPRCCGKGKSTLVQ